MQIFNILRKHPQNLTKRALYFFSQGSDYSKNLYTILQIDKSSSPEEIKKSYYKLAKKYHPDVNKGSDATFKEINKAYEILSNEDERRKYDEYLSGTQANYQRNTSQNYNAQYHYGYHNSYAKNRNNSYRRTNEYYDFSSTNNEKSDEFYARAAYNYNKRKARQQFDQRKYRYYYGRMNDSEDFYTKDYDMSKGEYDKFVKKMMFYPLVFMFFFAIFFFLPARNMGKEYVLFDEASGKVYVLDKFSYEEMKRNSNQKLRHPNETHAINTRRDFGGGY